MYYSGMANTPVTSLRLPEDLKEWVQGKAEAENRSMGNWIVTRLRQMKDAEAKPERKSRK